MYCVICNNEVIAYHKDENVIKEYCKSLVTSHPSMDLLIGKIRKKKIQTNQLEELYLIEKDGIYVPSGYEIYYDIMSQDYNEFRNTKDNLYVFLNTDLSLKEKRTIKKAIKVLESHVDDSRYVPSLEELRNVKNQYGQYIEI